MLWDQACIGLALLIVGLFLLGWAFHLSVDDKVLQPLVLLVGGICTIRQSGPFLVSGLRLDRD